MGIAKKRMVMFLTTLCVFVSVKVFGEYTGPSVVVAGGWGKADSEFGIDGEFPYDDFPKKFKINSRGNIFVSDMFNKRIKIYDNGGVPISIVNTDFWPCVLGCDSENNIVVSDTKSKIQKYDISGNLLWGRNLNVTIIEIQSNNNVIVYGKEAENIQFKYYLYSSDGQLLREYDEKPLELGRFPKLAWGKHEVEYPDMTYVINEDPPGEYVRLSSGILCGIMTHYLRRFDTSGARIGELTIPEDKHLETKPGGDGFEAILEVVEEYGDPVVAPNGDVFVWKRTKNDYSILKWTWQNK